jgi:hypothetical protein
VLINCWRNFMWFSYTTFLSLPHKTKSWYVRSEESDSHLFGTILTIQLLCRIMFSNSQPSLHVYLFTTMDSTVPSLCTTLTLHEYSCFILFGRSMVRLGVWSPAIETKASLILWRVSVQRSNRYCSCNIIGHYLWLCMYVIWPRV